MSVPHFSEYLLFYLFLLCMSLGQAMQARTDNTDPDAAIRFFVLNGEFDTGAIDSQIPNQNSI